MERPNDETIQAAGFGDEQALDLIYKYLKVYSAQLKQFQKDHLQVEKNSIILKGMHYTMKKDQMEHWGILMDDMIKRIRSEEITNLN